MNILIDLTDCQARRVFDASQTQRLVALLQRLYALEGIKALHGGE